MSGREKFYLCNTLAVLLKAVEGERTTVDLRNEVSIYGTVEQADSYMNIVMKDCVFTDPRGDKFRYEIFFVHARNIRYVHIPPNIPIIPAIKCNLQKLTSARPEAGTCTFKMKRALKNQQAGIAAVACLLKDKEGKSNPSIPGE